MWTVTLTHPSGSTTTAYSVTREDARRWARQFRAADDRVTITRPLTLAVSIGRDCHAPVAGHQTNRAKGPTMTTTTLALCVQIEENYGTYRAVARVVRPQPNGELHNVQWSDRFGDTGEDAARFDGLEISAYAGALTFGSSPDEPRGLWGFSVRFNPYRVESADHARAIAKTFAQIERGQTKLEAEDGYIRDGEFARYVMRVAKALRIRKVFVRNTPRARSLSGEDYRLADATFLDYWCSEVTDKITSHELSSLVR